MKKILFAAIGLIFILNQPSCTKDNIINGDVSQYALGSYLSYTTDVPSSPFPFDLSQINTSTVSISVKSVGVPATKVNIYVGDNTDKSTWKLIKTVSFTATGDLSVTGGELAAALGVNTSDFQPGDVFNLYNEVETADGRLFSAYNTSSDFQAQSSYKMAFQWQALIFCSFDQIVFNGNFLVVRDDWADFSAGDPIKVEAGPGENQISVTAYPSPSYGSNRVPMILDIDPSTNNVSVSSQVIGDYDGVVTSVSGVGSVNSCAGTIDLTLDIAYGTSVYSGLVLSLQKP